MISHDRYEISVVIAQMACEVSVERIFGLFFTHRGLKEFEAPIEDLLPSFNFGNDKVRKLYTALTGDNIQSEFFWSEYKTMVSIRNKAVHAGERIQKNQAQMVLRVAKLV